MLKAGPALQLKRKERGWTQLELVRKTGIPQPNLSDLEKGKQDMTLATFLKICRALAAKPGEILDSLVHVPKNPPFRCSRGTVERIAKAVVHEGFHLRKNEKAVADCLRKLVPGKIKHRFSDQRVYKIWMELRRMLGDSEIRILLERVQDELSRNA